MTYKLATEKEKQSVIEALARIISGLKPSPLKAVAARRTGLRVSLPLTCSRSPAGPSGEAAAIAAAERRAVEAEQRALDAQIRLGIAQVKHEALEAAAARAREADADNAVGELIRRGVIDRSDWLAQADLKVKLVADPELVALALGKRRARPLWMT